MTQHDAPTFDEPWQAQLFAMTVALQDRGLIDAKEWAEALGAELAATAHEPGNGPYYEAWLTALEKLMVRHGIASAGELTGLAAAWRAATEATPHGQPIELSAAGR